MAPLRCWWRRAVTHRQLRRVAASCKLRRDSDCGEQLINRDVSVVGVCAWDLACATCRDADRPAGFPLTCDRSTQRIRQVLANRAVNLGNKSHDTLRRACRANLHTVPDCVACDYTPSGKRRRKQQSRKLLPGHVRSEAGCIATQRPHCSRHQSGSLASCFMRHSEHTKRLVLKSSKYTHLLLFTTAVACLHKSLYAIERVRIQSTSGE